ncbi:NH3-dependent NAD+ synthetase [Sporohalobacter salinus]|nr:NH3-dependent NAD+ synthetase [Sporohalobacter salinus]
MVSKELDIDYEIIDFDDAFETLLSTVENSDNKMAKANMNPRFRMVVLYYYAELRNNLVIGT